MDDNKSRTCRARCSHLKEDAPPFRWMHRLRLAAPSSEGPAPAISVSKHPLPPIRIRRRDWQGAQYALEQIPLEFTHSPRA